MDTAPRFISSNEVFARITPRLAMDAVEAAFLASSRGELTDSASLGLAVPDATFHVKACASLGGIFVAKVNANFPSNPAQRGLPAIQGVIAVFDANDGRLRALVDSPSVTTLRTAATSAVAIRHLAREGARSVGIIGCGVQGIAHAATLADCMPPGELRAYDLDAAKSGAVAKAYGGKVAASIGEAAACDVVITCTPASKPFLGTAHVDPGTLIVGVGADNEKKAELEPGLVAAARVIPDVRMPDVVTGRVPRAGRDEVVVFGSVGLAIEDLALCELLVR